MSSHTPDSEAGSGAPPLPVTWRPVRIRATLTIVGALLATAFLVLAIALPHDGPGAFTALDRVGMVAFGFCGFAVLLLLSRSRAVADASGVTVVNIVRSRRLSWPQIVRVNLRPGDPWALLDLADGSTVAVLGIQPAGGRDQALRAARELHALAEEFGTARGQ